MLSVRLEFRGFIDTKEAVLALSELIGQWDYEPIQEYCILIDCQAVTGFSASALYYLSRVRRQELPHHQVFLVNKELDYSVEIAEASLLVV